METLGEPFVIEQLVKLNEYGLDDLFICCASFEERCLSCLAKMGTEFRTNYSIIFVIEDSLYKKQVDTNLFKLHNELFKKTSKGIFVISCNKNDPIGGINQLKKIWNQCQPKDPEEPFITLDISGFTKIYLLELLNYLVIDLNLGIPRMLHTTQKYLPNRLTRGVEQITTVPKFFGGFSWEKQTVLVLLLGFEAERSLAVWKTFNPTKTFALLTDPPRFENSNYLRYARENNTYLLGQPSVEMKSVPADNPYAVKNILADIYTEMQGSFNMVIGPFGTKPQVIGVFLCCLDFPKIQVVYSFPIEYTRSYIQRKPGSTFLLPLGRRLQVNKPG